MTDNLDELAASPSSGIICCEKWLHCIRKKITQAILMYIKMITEYHLTRWLSTCNEISCLVDQLVIVSELNRTVVGRKSEQRKKGELSNEKMNSWGRRTTWKRQKESLAVLTLKWGYTVTVMYANGEVPTAISKPFLRPKDPSSFSILLYSLGSQYSVPLPLAFHHLFLLLAPSSGFFLTLARSTYKWGYTVTTVYANGEVPTTISKPF